MSVFYTIPMGENVVLRGPIGISHNLPLACIQNPYNAQHVQVTVIAAKCCLLAWVGDDKHAVG